MNEDIEKFYNVNSVFCYFFLHLHTEEVYKGMLRKLKTSSKLSFFPIGLSLC